MRDLSDPPGSFRCVGHVGGGVNVRPAARFGMVWLRISDYCAWRIIQRDLLNAVMEPSSAADTR